MTIGDAVKKKVVDNETLGYYISRVHAFLVAAGIDEKHLRFRQHLPDEMAHYAKDCWDAEINTCYGWLECVGIADRSCFDLNAHAAATKVDEAAAAAKTETKDKVDEAAGKLGVDAPPVSMEAIDKAAELTKGKVAEGGTATTDAVKAAVVGPAQ